MNISSKLISQYPISVIFKIKQFGKSITDLTKKDILTHYECEGKYPSNYMDEELKLFKSIYNNYAGNSYTYYTFKQLIKLFLTEVYLYKYQGHIFTYNELLNYYNCSIYNQPDISSISSISELIESKRIEKIKSQCIKVMEPIDINYFPLSRLNLYLIDVSNFRSFSKSYNTLIEKSLGSFWDYDKENRNIEF